MNKNLVPANLDEKNVTTDWIREEFFDFEDNFAYKSVPFSNEFEYLGYVECIPVLLRYSGSSNHIDVKLCGIGCDNLQVECVKRRIKKIFEDTDFELTFMDGCKFSFEVRVWQK